jgi:hypothetical protein
MQKAITSLGHLEKCMPELIVLAEASRGRIVININRKSLKKCSFEMMKNLLLNIESGQCVPHRVFAKSAGNCKATNGKLWIIDIDTREDVQVDKAIKQIIEAQPTGPKVKHILDTPNGYHIITAPFNPMQVSFEWEIHKNNPTILYVPMSILADKAKYTGTKYDSFLENSKEYHVKHYNGVSRMELWEQPGKWFDVDNFEVLS